MTRKSPQSLTRRQLVKTPEVAPSEDATKKTPQELKAEEFVSKLIKEYGPNKKTFHVDLSRISHRNSLRIDEIAAKRMTTDETHEMLTLLDPSWTVEEFLDLSELEVRHMVAYSVVEYRRSQREIFS